MVLGTQPGKEALTGVPVFGKEKVKVVEEDKELPSASTDEARAKVAQQTSTLLSLLTAHES